MFQPKRLRTEVLVKILAAEETNAKLSVVFGFVLLWVIRQKSSVKISANYIAQCIEHRKRLALNFSFYRMGTSLVNAVNYLCFISF